MNKIIISLLIILLTNAFPYSQNPSTFSRLLNLNMLDPFKQESNSFALFAGKTVLQMETDPYKIAIGEAEIFTWKNLNNNLVESELMMNTVLDNIQRAGWQITTSPGDQDYHWLVRKNDYRVGYFAATARETAIYIGKTSQVPPFVKLSSPSNEPELIKPSIAPSQSGIPIPNTTISSVEIVGNWGDLKASQINYYDPNGMMVGSGLSKGYGFEFKSDHSYAQSFLATSSLPDYKIFIYTTGTYTLQGNQLILTPQDRHYRKWESDVLTTDEHSRPEGEQYTWSIHANSTTGKNCLYLIRAGESETREYCQE